MHESLCLNLKIILTLTYRRLQRRLRTTDSIFIDSELAGGYAGVNSDLGNMKLEYKFKDAILVDIGVDHKDIKPMQIFRNSSLFKH